MASNSSLGAALGGEGTADKIPGGSLPALVLGRLGYTAGAGAPRLVSAEWRGETDRLFGRELEIQVALRDPHNELLTHYLNSAVAAGDVEEARRLIGAGASPNVEVCRFDEDYGGRLIEEPSIFWALTFDSLELLELLLEAGADLVSWCSDLESFYYAFQVSPERARSNAFCQDKP